MSMSLNTIWRGLLVKLLDGYQLSDDGQKGQSKRVIHERIVKRNNVMRKPFKKKAVQWKPVSKSGSKRKLAKKKAIKFKPASKKAPKVKAIRRRCVRKVQPKLEEQQYVVKKYIDNPIIVPEKKNDWEAWQTFNPAATLINDNVHFLYRAIGTDGVSRFGYASSMDGFKVDYRHSEPAYQDFNICREYNCYSLVSGGSWSGCEDPRMSLIEEDKRIYVTYTSCSGGLRVGLLSISVEDFENKRWNWSKPKLISPPDEVHKNWVIFPEKINGKYAIMHSISPEMQIEYLDNLDFKNGECIQSHYNPGTPSHRWDSFLRGPGPTPIKTKYGWLLFYHAMSRDDMGSYKVGAMLLDLKDPTRILHRSKMPVLEPKEFYEMSGFKPGVVYILGAVVKEDNLIMYYGGADNYVCAAYVNYEEFLQELIKKEDKLLKKKLLKIKK